MEEEEEDDLDQVEEEEEEDLGPSVEELIERARMEQQRLQELNEMLQKKVGSDNAACACVVVTHSPASVATHGSTTCAPPPHTLW